MRRSDGNADALLQELLDKQAITEVIYRYGRSMDRLDRDLGRSSSGRRRRPTTTNRCIRAPDTGSSTW